MRRPVMAFVQVVALVVPLGTNAQQTSDSWSIADLNRALSRKPIAEVGILDGEACALLGRIQDALLDESGRAVVLDGIAQRITVFEPDGRCAYSIGRKGAGPGEFGGAWRLRLTGDQLFVLDPRNLRIEQFELGHTSARRVTSYRIDARGLDFCGIENDFYVVAAHQTAVIHRFSQDGRLLRSFGSLYDGADDSLFQISGPGLLDCDVRGSRFTVAGHQVPDIHQYDQDGRLRWKTRIPEFLEAELIMDGSRVRGFRPSSSGLHYMASLVRVRPYVALVQAGTPTDLGVRKNRSFLLDLERGVLLQVADEGEWPRIYDIRGDLMLVDADSDFPQLAIHRR